jgi:hypothetical protein
VLLTAALKNRKHISTPGDQLAIFQNPAVISVAKNFLFKHRKGATE